MTQVAAVESPQLLPFVVRGKGSWVAQHIDVEGERGHSFDADAYPAFGGQDSAPSPLFFALGALSSCNQVTGNIVAKGLGLRLGEWSFQVQGDLDPRVLTRGVEGNANFSRVTVHVTVETDADEERFATFSRETERRCPVTQLFKRSGLAFTSTWQRRPLARAAR